MTGHPDLTPLLRGDDLAGEARRELLAHLRGCAHCRAEVVQDDPAVLFSLLALDPVPDTVLGRVFREATAAIAREQIRARRSRRRSYAIGALAASLLLAAVIGITTIDPETGPVPQVPRVVEAETPPEVVESALPAGFVEVLDTPGSADVVNVAVEEIDFVMIFDEEFGI